MKNHPLFKIIFFIYLLKVLTGALLPLPDLMLRQTALTAVCLLLASSAVGDDGIFRSQVAPILERRCLSCHDGAEAKGGLSL